MNRIVGGVLTMIGIMVGLSALSAYFSFDPTNAPVALAFAPRLSEAIIFFVAAASGAIVSRGPSLISAGLVVIVAWVSTNIAAVLVVRRYSMAAFATLSLNNLDFLLYNLPAAVFGTLAARFVRPTHVEPTN